MWSLQHAQLYAETERLAAAGYLRKEVETSGRRRKFYELTGTGREALALWLRTPTSEPTELRDPGLLQLFMGANPAVIGPAQAEAHAKKLSEYEFALASCPADIPIGIRLSIQAGVAHERVWVEFWTHAARTG